jgi:prepilin-type N-terminal cleavage/methylation domain-containing protein
MSRAVAPDTLRRAFTLVEMLVVVAILVLVTALAVTIAAPNNEARRLREAARQVNSFITGARARAIESGRPFGVLVEPLPGDGQVSMRLSYVEVAPPYCGDLITSRAIVVDTDGDPTTSADRELRLEAMPGGTGSVPDTGWVGLVQVGDRIRFNSQGHEFSIVDLSTDSNGTTRWKLASASGRDPATLPVGVPMPYCITLGPRRSSAPALELPDGVVIDVPGSGIGPSGTLSAGISLVVLFTPGGSVRVQPGLGVPPTVPSGPVYLLIGRREHAGTAGNFSGVFDTLWVAVNHRNGQVQTVDNNGAGTTVAEARLYARRMEQLGGQ